jgi:hypothetical protein
VNITPTPLTATLAGFFSANALPLVWSRLGDSSFSGSIESMLAFVLVVALPAHIFVLGFNRQDKPAPGTLDRALLMRGGAWLLAVVVTVLVAGALRTA